MPLPLGSLLTLTQEISGFFIVESHVLETTGSFRSLRDVEELWEGVAVALTTAIENALRAETDAESFLKVKENLLTFIMTLGVGARLRRSSCCIKAHYLQTSSYSTASLHSFIIVLFEKYANLLQAQFTRQFEAVSLSSDLTHKPLFLNDSS